MIHTVENRDFKGAMPFDRKISMIKGGSTIWS